MADTTIRQAVAGDALAIADLHATSWRSAYRGILSDAFLDGSVIAERRDLWQARFSGGSDSTVFIAEQAGVALGFICFEPDRDPVWGGLIDNFHVLPQAKGQGIGRKLFDRVRRFAKEAQPGKGLYLFVFAQNVAAQKAYDGLDGRVVEALTKLEPDGQEHALLRYAWDAAQVADVGAGE